eukprot:COSAG01_NODE_178_length_22933_cov_18.398529_15_plen_104_part_00
MSRTLELPGLIWSVYSPKLYRLQMRPAVCALPGMLRRASRNPVATSTKGIACGNRVGVKRRRLLLRDLSDLPSPFTFVRSSHLPAVGAGKHTRAHPLFQSDLH